MISDADAIAELNSYIEEVDGEVRLDPDQTAFFLQSLRDQANADAQLAVKAELDRRAAIIDRESARANAAKELLTRPQP